MLRISITKEKGQKKETVPLRTVSQKNKKGLASVILAPACLIQAGA